MAAAEAAGNAPAGRQAGGKANAAELRATVRREVWMDESLATLTEYAKEYGGPVYAVVEMIAEPSGVIKLAKRSPIQPVWLELQELIDP